MMKESLIVSSSPSAPTDLQSDAISPECSSRGSLICAIIIINFVRNNCIIRHFNSLTDRQNKNYYIAIIRKNTAVQYHNQCACEELVSYPAPPRKQSLDFS